MRKQVELTNNQKKFLRKLAHDLNPVVMIGQHGFSQSVQEELLSSLAVHELLKIKLRVEKSEKQTIIQDILSTTHSTLVQVVGGVVVIYKPFEDAEARQIILPRK
jgi:RNA-binding protein